MHIIKEILFYIFGAYLIIGMLVLLFICRKDKDISTFLKSGKAFYGWGLLLANLIWLSWPVLLFYPDIYKNKDKKTSNK